MNNPDFSQSPEHVALANAMVDTLDDSKRWASVLGYEDIYRMADAAITFFGSGYRLPEATEANAERLAAWKHGLYGFPATIPVPSLTRHEAKMYLRGINEVFAEPAPEPVFPGMPAPEPRPYPPGPTPCGDAKFIPPTGARPDGSLVTHVVPPTPEADSPADPMVCRPGCDRKFGHPGPHSDEMQEEIIPRRVIFTALASNPHLMEVLMDMERREDRVACIQRWASIFEEAACRK